MNIFKAHSFLVVFFVTHAAAAEVDWKGEERKTTKMAYELLQDGAKLSNLENTPFHRAYMSNKLSCQEKEPVQHYRVKHAEVKFHHKIEQQAWKLFRVKHGEETKKKTRVRSSSSWSMSLHCIVILCPWLSFILWNHAPYVATAQQRRSWERVRPFFWVWVETMRLMYQRLNKDEAGNESDHFFGFRLKPCASCINGSTKTRLGTSQTIFFGFGLFVLQSKNFSRMAIQHTQPLLDGLATQTPSCVSCVRNISKLAGRGLCRNSSLSPRCPFSLHKHYTAILDPNLFESTVPQKYGKLHISGLRVWCLFLIKFMDNS